MSESPFQFITHRGPQFVEHDVHWPNGMAECGLMNQSQVQSLIAEHLKAIDELSGTETVAMIRLPCIGINSVLVDMCIEHGEDIRTTESNGWLRVWKK